MGKLIALIGNTGVGKTSVACALANTGEFKLGLEDHYNRPFQTLFKSDSRFALANQIDYLLLRAEQERTLRQNPLPGLLDGGLDQDFHGFTQLFYTRRKLSEPEYKICCRLYTFIRSQLPPPDLVIHLTASRAAIQQRLADRKRINIADPDDFDLLDSYLRNWSSSLPRQQVLYFDLTSASSEYLELLPNLHSQIRSRLGLDIGSYDTGYTP